MEKFLQYFSAEGIIISVIASAIFVLVVLFLKIFIIIPQENKGLAILRITKFAIEMFIRERGYDKYHYEFHSLEVLKMGAKGIVIQLTLGNPGLFIGKGGRQIDEFTEILSGLLDSKVEIQIKEQSFWKADKNKYTNK